MPPPLIGITMDRDDQKPGRCKLYCDYVASIELAGGIPVALPSTLDHHLIPALLDRLDGVLFSGGDDIDPALWGEPRHPNAVPLDPVRQAFELALLAEVERRRIPALGICLGSQIMNVHRGGTLHQFLPDLLRPQPLEHRRLDRDWPSHPVHLEPASILARALGKNSIIANTYHKQSINRVGQNLRVVARAPDGVIEAVEDAALPLFLAVQWHPERLRDDPDHLTVFQLLVRAASAT